MWASVFTSSSITLNHSQFYTMLLSARQLLFRKSITQNYQLNDTGDLQSIVVCDNILTDGNYPQHHISLVTLMLLSDLFKESAYCKTVSLKAFR